MSFQDFIKGLFFKKQLSVGYVARTQEKPLAGNEQTDADISERFWDRSIYYHNAVEKMAKVVAMVGFKVHPRPDAPEDITTSGRAKKEKKLLLDFMLRPTKGFDETWEALIYRTVSKFIVHGQCGWEAIKGTYPTEDKPNAMSFHVHLIDGWVTPRHDERGRLVEGEGAFEQYFAGEIVKFQRDQVVFFRYPDPFRTWKGKTPIQLLASQIAMELHSQDYNLKFYENSAVPSGIFSLPEFLMPEEFEAAKQRLTEAYLGVHNAHTAAIVLSGQVTYQPIQSNPNEAQLDQVREKIRDEIMVTLGSPPPVLGYSSADGKVEVSEVDNSFLRYNVPFIQALFAGQINMFCQEVLGYQYYMLKPLTADVVKNAAEINALINEVQYGILTANEAREKLNEEPHPDGDQLLLPNTPLGPQTVGSVGSDLPEASNDKEDTKIKPQPVTREEVKAAMEILSIIKSLRQEPNNDQ